LLQFTISAFRRPAPAGDINHQREPKGKPSGFEVAELSGKHPWRRTILAAQTDLKASKKKTYPSPEKYEKSPPLKNTVADSSPRRNSARET